MKQSFHFPAFLSCTKCLQTRYITEEHGFDWMEDTIIIHIAWHYIYLQSSWDILPKKFLGYYVIFMDWFDITATRTVP